MASSRPIRVAATTSCARSSTPTGSTSKAWYRRGRPLRKSGINERFHKIEADLDALGDNVRRAFICVETLRAQLSICLNEIVTVLNAKDKDNKEKEQSKDTKDTKDNDGHQETQRTPRNKDTKDNKEAETSKDTERQQGEQGGQGRQ